MLDTGTSVMVMGWRVVDEKRFKELFAEWRKVVATSGVADPEAARIEEEFNNLEWIEDEGSCVFYVDEKK